MGDFCFLFNYCNVCLWNNLSQTHKRNKNSEQICVKSWAERFRRDKGEANGWPWKRWAKALEILGLKSWTWVRIVRMMKKKSKKSAGRESACGTCKHMTDFWAGYPEQSDSPAPIPNSAPMQVTSLATRWGALLSSRQLWRWRLPVFTGSSWLCNVAQGLCFLGDPPGIQNEGSSRAVTWSEGHGHRRALSFLYHMCHKPPCFPTTSLP